MTSPPTLGLVLAGGLARRMGGGDKARIRIGGATILQRVLGLHRPAMQRRHHQCQWRSGALCRYRPAGGRRQRAGFCRSAGRHSRRPRLGGGECAGIANGSLSVPGDCPFLPKDLVARLHEARAAAGTPLACARSGDGAIRWSALWPVALREDLRRALVDEDLRKIEIWTARHGVAIADWPAEPVDPFFNVNTPEDAARAEAIAAQYSARLTLCSAHDAQPTSDA